jgi:antirestriction protein ArdC
MGAVSTTGRSRSSRSASLTSEERAQRDLERRQKLEALHEQFTAQVTELVDGGQWQAMLAAAARFHAYSFGNVLLTLRQNPEATRVAGYRTWQSLDLQVRKGERGIQILAPVTYRPDHENHRDDADSVEAQDRPRQLRGFKVEHVWDISQTDGEPLPDIAPALLEGDGPAGLWEALAGQVAADGYELERGRCARPQANGETDPSMKTVTVRDDLSPAQAAKTLVHERAHILLGHVNGLASYQACRGRFEVEAESVAYLVCTQLGIDADDYSLPYVARWADGDIELIQKTAERVVIVARSILNGVLPLEEAA